MNTERYLTKIIADDLLEKMVFLGGPRQVGKTTLARRIGATHYEQTEYLNWDNKDHRKSILDGRHSAVAGLHIFDELHKYKQWKNHIKGLFDTRQDDFHIMVTGSARLDVYRRGGDSLMGRYHHYRLHPFSAAEALGIPCHHTPGESLNITFSAEAASVCDHLYTFGGFPEPFIKGDSRTVRRWHNQRLERLVREDIRDTENIRDLSALQIVIEHLPALVGSLFSLNSLREEVSVAHKTITQWIDMLERFYYLFRIYPYTASKVRSLKKEPKLYLWDWSEVTDPAARLENMVASHLLKLTHFLYDGYGHKVDLHFLRDIDGREVDFLVSLNGNPWLAVEVKSTASAVSKHLHYFRSRLAIPYCYQVVGENGIDFLKDGIRVTSVGNLLSALI